MGLHWHADWLGWLAAALMVATFGCREARCMRPLAVATNLAFIGYGLTAALAPVLALHALLLPINLWRWWECTRHRLAIPSPPPGSVQAGSEPWSPNSRPTLRETPP
jgi:hypothetical protein